MSYTLRVHVPEAEPYTGLEDYDAVRTAVEEEAGNTVNDLGSDILDTGSEEEREEVTERLVDEAMDNLWRISNEPTQHFFPGRIIDHEIGRRVLGVKLTLYKEDIDTHDFFNDVTNEITGTGYTAGGRGFPMSAEEDSP